MMPELLSVNEGTCVPLYMLTHPTHPDNPQDLILIKNEKANGDALYLLGKDLEKRSGEISLAQDATTTNP
jgi:hypothetical protein